MKTFVSSLLFLGAIQAAFAGYTFHPVSAGSWGANDAVLGVDGYVIEDFEDVNLVSGLQVSVSSVNGGYGPTSTIPNTFDPFTDSTAGTAFQSSGGGAWDGRKGLINTRTNREFTYTEGDSWGKITLHFSAPVSSLGFSLQQSDLPLEVLIDGVSYGNLNALGGWGNNGGRQGYMRIDGTAGSTISTLTFVNGESAPFRDGIMIDHVAFNPVPEPTSMLALGLGVLAMVRRRRK